jgi:hypothetical protein
MLIIMIMGHECERGRSEGISGKEKERILRGEDYQSTLYTYVNIA